MSAAFALMLLGTAGGLGTQVAPGADAPTLCVVGRASDQVKALAQAPRSAEQEARELDAVADALLRCPSAGEKARSETRREAAAPARTAYRLNRSTLPAGNA